MTLSWITHLVQSYGYYAVFTLIALESMGIPLPGETALISAALYAGTTHHFSVVVLAVVATAAAVIGDNAGYWIGRTGGLRLAERHGRYVRLDRAKLRAGRYLFARHGWKVVFFGRFVAVLRTFAAFFAGVGRMHWPRFLAANAAGGLLWASFYTFGAYALGSAASSVGSTITIAGYAVASVVTVTSIIMVRRSMRRLEQRAAEAFPEEQEGKAVKMARTSVDTPAAQSVSATDAMPGTGPSWAPTGPGAAVTDWTGATFRSENPIFIPNGR